MNVVYQWLGAILDLLRRIFAVDTDIQARVKAMQVELDAIKQLIISGPPVPPEDIVLSGFVDNPVNQGSKLMANKITDQNIRLHATLAVKPMLDDQKALIHVIVSQGGVQIPLPAGQTLTWTTQDANMTVNPAVGIDGTPNTDPLAAVGFGVHGVAADTSVIATLPANADGTVPTATFPFHITVDPAELDITLSGTVDAPVPQ